MFELDRRQQQRKVLRSFDEVFESRHRFPLIFILLENLVQKLKLTDNQQPYPG